VPESSVHKPGLVEMEGMTLDERERCRGTEMKKKEAALLRQLL